MNDAVNNFTQRLNGYLYNKKVRLAVFWALIACTLAVFVPLVLSDEYRASVIHAMETLIVHRKLRQHDKWHGVLCSFGLLGIVCAALVVVLCRKKYAPLKALTARLSDDAFIEKVLYFFVMASFAIIATALVNQSFWGDEGLALGYIRLPYSKMLYCLAHYDTHPPLYFVITKFLVAIAHTINRHDTTTIIACKLVSIAPMLLLVCVALTKVKRNWGGLCGAFFAVMVTAAPWMMFYAVEIRNYSWLTLFTVLVALFAYDCAVQPTRKSWVLLTLCTAAAFYTHYFGAVSALAVYIALIVWCLWHDKKRALWCILSGAAALVLFSPWLGYCVSTFHKLSGDNDYWALPISAKDVKYFALYPFYFDRHTVRHIFIAALVLIYGYILVRYVMQCAKKKEAANVEAMYLLASTAAVYYFTVLVGCIVSWTVRPVFVARYAVQAVPLVWLALAIALCRSKYTKCSGAFAMMIAAIALVANIETFASREFFQAQHSPEFVSLLRAIDKENKATDEANRAKIVARNCSAMSAYLAGNTKVYNIGRVNITTQGLTDMLFPNMTRINTSSDNQQSLIESMSRVSNTAGNVYYLIEPEDDDEFHQFMAQAPVPPRFVGDYQYNWYRFKVYLLGHLDR